MKFDVAEQPPRRRVVQWDGTNVDEVDAYIESVNDPDGKAWVEVHDDGTAGVRKTSGTEKPLVPGALVYAEPFMWGGPVITVYTPEEARATLYPYPEFPPVTGEA